MQLEPCPLGKLLILLLFYCSFNRFQERGVQASCLEPALPGTFLSYHEPHSAHRSLLPLGAGQVSIGAKATPAPGAPTACPPPGEGAGSLQTLTHMPLCPWRFRESWLLLLGPSQVTAGEFSFLLRAPLLGSSAGKMPSAGAGPRGRRIDEMTSRQPCHLPDSGPRAARPWPWL